MRIERVFLLTKCATNFIFLNESGSDEKKLSADFSQKALDQSRAKNFIKLIETWYATTAACIHMHADQREAALALTQKYDLYQERSLFEQRPGLL
jgi:hypothetical protein